MRIFAKKSWVLGLVFLLAGGLLLAVAQQPPPPREGTQGPLEPKTEEEEAPYALRVDVPIVNVDVSVVDRDGNFIYNLRKEHFRVYQDGEEQEIVAFAPTEAPLTTVMLVEASPAVGYLLYDNVEAAYYFLRQLRDGDWIAVMSYAMKPEIQVDFTRNHNEVAQSLRRLYYSFGGFREVNMYDAVIDTLERLQEVEGKKSIILIGTGFDTFSKHTWDDMRKVVREQGSTIFTVNTTFALELYYDRLESYGYRTGLSRSNMLLARAQMRDLADQTGGRAYTPRFLTQMPAIYQEIGAILRNQYSLAFRPKDFKRDGKFHEIDVKLMGPDGEPLRVVNQDGDKVKYEIYARKGYYAPEA